MSVSSNSTPKLCRHFGTCGGCSLQDRPYEAQLAYKKEKILAALAGLTGLPPLDVLGSPRIWHYRNKMEFSFGDVYPADPRHWLKLGMKAKGRWYSVFDLEECHLPSPEAADLLRAVRVWAEREKIPPYNGHKKEGVLRHLVLREAKNRPERMIILVCSAGEAPKTSFVEAALASYPATSILIGRHESDADVAVSQSLEVLFGPGHVTETLRFPDGALDYRISPHSFFQTNTSGAEVLYGLLRAWTRELKAGLVLDLYCGGGGIALSLAGAARKVIGVESNSAAVADAKANAALNGIANCEFYGAPAEFLLPSLLDMRPGVAVVDPPRAGLHSAAVKAVLESPPPVLFYVSCNPDSLARDLKALGTRYAVSRLAMIDLFPHTDHVETVAWLKL